MTKEEKIALEKIESSLTYNGNRYSIAMPWKEDNLVLTNNREMAKKRLESTERSLNAKGAFVKQQYEETIKSYVEKERGSRGVETQSGTLLLLDAACLHLSTSPSRSVQDANERKRSGTAP